MMLIKDEKGKHLRKLRCSNNLVYRVLELLKYCFGTQTKSFGDLVEKRHKEVFGRNDDVRLQDRVNLSYGALEVGFG